MKYATQLSCNFQHSHCTFVTILFGCFARLFINLTMCIRVLFTKSASIFGLAEQAFWRMPFFTEWNGASSFEVILARQSSHFLTWASASGTSGSRCIFHTLLRRRSENDSAVSILHAYSYRVGNCNCFLSNTARKLSIANNLLDFFVHAVSSFDS